MRDSDRLWWVPGLICLGMFVAANLAPWWLPRLPAWPDSNPTDPLTLIASVIIGFMSLGVSIYDAFATRTMRRRHMRRLAALHGDDAAMPLSIIRPFPERAPDVGAQPVDNMWRAHPVEATGLALTMGISLLGVFVIPGFILACVLLSRLQAVPKR